MTRIVALFLLFVASTLQFLNVEAQRSVPKNTQADESEGAGLLRTLVSGKDAAKKIEARRALIALGSDKLAQAIKNLPFDKAQTGRVKRELTCPDNFMRPYFLYIPESYDPATSYPVLIIMYGAVSGSDSSSAIEFLDYMESWLPDESKEDVIVMSVAANVPATKPEAVWFHLEGQLNVLAALRDVKLSYNIDDDKVFIGGASDGGTGAYSFAERRTDAFAGYFPWIGHPQIPLIAGTEVWFENLKGSNIYHIIGGMDELYPVDTITAVLENIREAGAKVESKIYDEAGHDLRYMSGELPIILDEKIANWSRCLLPEEIDWSTDTSDTGRRAWLSIDAIGPLDKANADCAPRPQSIASRGPLLGIMPRATSTTVDQINPGSLAERMGVLAGDRIMKINDTDVSSLNDIRSALAETTWDQDITITVERGDEAAKETKELKGHIPKEPVESSPTPQGRTCASRTKAGIVDIKVYNVTKLSVWVAPEMFDEKGKLTVAVNGKEAYAGKPIADAALMLKEFERTGDRKLPCISRIEIDVAKLFGVEIPGEKPTSDEEDF